MRVDLIQFLRPDGRQRPVWCDGIPDELKPKYDAIRENGMRLTCEELMTGMVSLAIEHPSADYKIELCRNEPDAPKLALEKLIRSFEEAEFDVWLAELKRDGAA